MFSIAAFYHFTPVDDPEALRQNIEIRAETLNIKGVVLVATEGINGTVAGTADAIAQFVDFLKNLDGFSGIKPKFAQADLDPFPRLSVKLKKEIVPLGVEGIDPNARVGTYVPPADWDDLIQQEDVLLIDCRNSYEFEVGTFEGAVDPGTTTFREFPEYAKKLDPSKTPRVAMFCTGGIRCEKATGLMLDLGFSEVYHLEGGILRYLEERGPQSQTWRGECFVFDRRVSVDPSLQPGSWDVCWACSMPVNDLDKQSPLFEEGVSCPRCHDTWSPEKMRGKRERHALLLREKREQETKNAPDGGV